MKDTHCSMKFTGFPFFHSPTTLSYHSSQPSFSWKISHSCPSINFLIWPHPLGYGILENRVQMPLLPESPAAGTVPATVSKQETMQQYLLRHLLTPHSDRALSIPSVALDPSLTHYLFICSATLLNINYTSDIKLGIGERVLKRQDIFLCLSYSEFLEVGNIAKSPHSSIA